jgi:hypothetical protein
MITITKTVDELLETKASPLPLKVIPNHMGINLCSVESLTWTRQTDGQPVHLAINFLPNNDKTGYDDTQSEA